MTVKNLRFIAIALAAVAVSACQKEPSTSDLHKEYLVYTAHDTKADFAAVETYFIPDSILVIGSNDKINPKSNINRAEMAVILHRVLTY